MKKLIFALILALAFCSNSFAWIDTTGSTFPVTSSSEGWEIKDIQNDVHDIPHSAWSVYNVSSGPYHDRMWVWDSDLSQWIELAVSSTNADDISINSKSQKVKSFLYGYSGAAWDRIQSDPMHYLWTRTSTDSITQARLYDWTGSVWQTTDIYGLARSTGQDITIDRIDKMNMALFGVARSSGMDLAIQEIQKANLALFGVARSTGIDSTIIEIQLMAKSLFGVARSTGVDLLIQRTEENTASNFGVARSSGVDILITRLNLLLEELYGLSRSTGTDISITRQDTTIVRLNTLLTELYGLSRSTGTDIIISRIESLRTDLYGVARSTGIDAIITRLYEVLIATGAVQVTNFPTDYPDSSSASAISDVATAVDNMSNILISSVPVVGLDYSNKISTYAAGEIYADGNIVINFDVDYFAFKGVDGDARALWGGGSYIPFDEGGFESGKYQRIIPRNVTFILDLINATTVWYYIQGAN